MDGTDIRQGGGGRSRRAASVWVPKAVPVPAPEAPSPGTAQYSGQQGRLLRGGDRQALTSRVPWVRSSKVRGSFTRTGR